MGVWIEIEEVDMRTTVTRSLPSWECGLKSKLCKGDVMVAEVTPFVGVWIEIQKHEIGTQAKDVTPFMK